MERRSRDDKKLPLCISVVVLGLVSSSCCIAAEFSKVKVEDMKLDGNLCSLPRSCAFGLGIAALVCLSTSQIIGTTMARSIRRKAAGVYGVSSVLLATASSMNGGQRYGTGWMNGDCYIVRDGVYACSAALAVFVMLLTLALGFATAAAGDEPRADGERCGPQLKEPRVVDSVKG
ncbi:hypothetical protein ZIOFF_021018 [Zingiber officinale]|uniref:Uncharacterized protein n=1 Tax=Zingiber officinale TaxID=94328 RepID=A0A8J5LG72_ZINOF|nr:hypothetical protein ZIOFF_021018 [Zingiber officinale]